jgi:hypothetical protein
MIHGDDATPRQVTRMSLLGARSPRLAAIMLGVYALGVAPSLGQSLLETHAHRQTQTAYTAVIYAERGIDLFRPPLPVLGPPGFIPQEFPIFQALGALVMDLSVPADMSMRIVGLVSFLASAAMLYLLARRLMGEVGALVALGAYLFNAHAWLYGRTSLIEYQATAAGLAFLYLAIRWMGERRMLQWIAAAVAGVLAILVKITTGGFLLLPALLWRSNGRWGFQRPSVVALVALAVAVGGVWSAYAQGVREETPASIFLSMENQWSWFFGTLDQRFDPGSWRVPIVAILTLTGFGVAVWAPIAVASARLSPQRAFMVSMLALVAVVPLLLFNLYAIHDYYWAAVAPMIAIGIGLATEWLLARRRKRRVRRAIVGLAGAWIATIIGSFGSWSIIYTTPAEESRAMAMADFIRDHSAPDDWVVLRGWGWNSTFLYYARRQGMAVPSADPNLQDGSFGAQDISEINFDAILSDPIFGPFIYCDLEGQCRVGDEP